MSDSKPSVPDSTFASEPQSQDSLDLLLVAQRHILEVLTGLMMLDQRVHEIRRHLPLPAVYLAMEDGSVPYDAFGLLYAQLGQVQGQRLQSAVEELRALIQISEEDLLVPRDDEADPLH